MEEIEKIKYAKTFIDKLADGINPLDDSPLAEYDIVNNVRLSRCFFYVSEILGKVIDNGGFSKNKYLNKSSPKKPFYITPDQLKLFKYSIEPIPLSTITSMLNSLVDTSKYKKITYKLVAEYLVSINILALQPNSTGKFQKVVTQKGKELGLFVDKRKSIYQEYDVILYNMQAQKFIIENIDKIIS